MARLWDAPVRIVHWSLVLLIPAMWWTAEEGKMERHVQLGLVALGLVVFRIVWGFVGSEPARFRSFVRGPGAILGYLRGRINPVGHSPLGALSIIALLTLLVVQMALGLVAQDVDGLFSGPLSHLVSYDTSEAAREWHHRGFDLLLWLIGLHLAAILFYAVVRRRNLVTAMLTGRRDIPPNTPAPRMAPAWAGVPVAVVAAGLAWWIGRGAPGIG
ncbi:cytochrome b/b6 domain-containing protein [Sandaracinobacteroides saxicola]|uniref:Cytochrome b/b6 domain-containing protein n=1 Tax=Sandaracinobacteroides saxicola TaxID=2759707 RepID=A0A7G5II09_9SPHN|nr:cytochrome b/b6 domain-containing protein [Sandaracinobacteroides saxicola]QMW23001.1 cytochrome b/b6 domain-containing protein [Sandaracinobacteroides saxicola]